MNEFMNKVLNHLENIYNNQQLYYGIMLALFLVWLLLFVILIKLILDKKKKANNKPFIEPIIIGEDVQVESKEDLQALLTKMEKDMENKEDTIKTFEDEQEEKAIISYQELIDASIKNTEEDTEIEEQEPENLDFTIIDSPKKFKNTEFISPVYGRVDSNNENNIELPNEEQFIEETLDKSITQVKEEKPIEFNNNVDSIDEFLNDLKRFRRNLE